jgi:hypothetical protein
MKERNMKEKSGSESPLSRGTDIGRRTMLKSAALVMGAGAAIPSFVAAENAPATIPSSEAAL